MSFGYCVFTFEGGDWSHDDFGGLERGFEQAKRLGIDYLEVLSLILPDRSRSDAEVLNRLGMCLDAGHIIAGGGDPHEVVAKHPERVDYVHLKDVDPAAYAAASGPGKYAASRDPGTGPFDFRPLVEDLKRGGFTGTILAENDLSPDPVASMEQSVHYLRDTLQL